MRSRYHPDGSIDYEADRMLETLRHADDELERRQRERSVSEAPTQQASSAPIPSKATVPTMPTIADFLSDPIAELTQPVLPANPISSNPTRP